MSESDRNEAVEKIIGNMTAELQNVDGQYVSLGFTPPPPEPLNWGQHQYINNYNSYPTNPEIPLRYQMEPLNFDYLQQPQSYDINNEYNKNLEALKYNIFQAGDSGVFPNNYNVMSRNVGMNEDLLATPHEPVAQASSNNHMNNTHLIENLVGNWVPNTSGTYSPFGNDPFKPSVAVFDQIQTEINPAPRENVIGQILEDHNLEEKQFQFNRNRKPRMVAEVKPMRPSYSDVLTKSVPQTVNKTIKPDTNNKDAKKEKKDNKKTSKNEKGLKPNTPQNRTSNQPNDLKESNSENNNKNFAKSTNTINTDKTANKGAKTSQLNRKWASLDNINEPINIKPEENNKKKKTEDNVFNKSFPQKTNFRKTPARNSFESVENDAAGPSKSANETFYINKNGLKKPNNKFSSRQKNSDSGANERPVGKRNQRVRKRENNVLFGIVSQKLKQYLKGWWKIITVFLFWLIHLISDICSLSIHIGKDMASNFWHSLNIHWTNFVDTLITIIKRIHILSWIYEKFKKAPEQERQKESNGRTFLYSGLQNNINMPTTGEEAMKRLLACKGKDPYSILGVTPTCSDDDIKRYYKRQAFLVHPDKNQQPGAEEAFKILVHAFDMIGEPTRRAAYDKGVVESVQVEQAWSELTELLAQLQQKVDAAANTIRCSACGLRHKRIKMDRPSYAARNCSSCKIHHAAREGDIWAEARCFGFLWHYYACMEGGVYDITEWAGCQKDSLKHLRPDSHQVQYRIALGKQNNQPRRHSGSPRNEKPPDLENLLNTLYGQSDGMQQQQQQQQQGTGARNRRNKNKTNK